jgi:hypothetical protein
MRTAELRNITHDMGLATLGHVGLLIGGFRLLLLVLMIWYPCCRVGSVSGFHSFVCAMRKGGSVAVGPLKCVPAIIMHIAGSAHRCCIMVRPNVGTCSLCIQTWGLGWVSVCNFGIPFVRGASWFQT